MEKFEQASRMKLRFNTDRGAITTEDLWDLPLEENGILDELARDLTRQMKDAEVGSFVVKKSSTSALLELQLDIVKHVITNKLAEVERKEQELVRKAKKQKILGIMARKEDAELEDLSKEELEKLLEGL